MPRKSPFKHHRFPREIILCAVRWYLRYPLRYHDVGDLPEERGFTDQSRSAPTKPMPIGASSAKATAEMTRISTVSVMSFESGGTI